MARKKQKDLADVASIVDEITGGGPPGNGHDAEGLLDAEEAGDVDELIEQTASRRPTRTKQQGYERQRRSAATASGARARDSGRTPPTPDRQPLAPNQYK